eukprot:2107482-Pyramimonas_sp.AAC.1
MEGMFAGGVDPWEWNAKGGGKGQQQAQPVQPAPAPQVHAASAPVFLPAMTIAQHELALSHL